MTDSLNLTYRSIDEGFSDRSAATRRQIVAGAAAALGSMGVLAVATEAAEAKHSVDPQTLLNVAATAEALATIVNTVGPEKVQLDATTRANIDAAAREELVHYEVLTSREIGGKALATRIWVPDAVFASREGFLKTLVAGDQIFINAYLIGTTTFGNDGNGRLARISAEFMGVEAVHRALALQSLGVLGNDRVFMKYSQPEENRTSPRFGEPGFRRITSAVTILQGLGFGFGKEGARPGAFYDFEQVRTRTPNPVELTTRSPR